MERGKSSNKRSTIRRDRSDFDLRRCFIEQFTPLIINASERPPVQRTGVMLYPLITDTPDMVPSATAEDFHDWSHVTPVNGHIPLFNPPPPRRKVASNPRYFYSGTPKRSRTVVRRSGAKRWGKK